MICKKCGLPYTHAVHAPPDFVPRTGHYHQFEPRQDPPTSSGFTFALDPSVTDRLEQVVKDLLAHDRKAAFDEGVKYALETGLPPFTRDPFTTRMPIVLTEAIRILGHMPVGMGTRIFDGKTNAVIFAVRFESEEAAEAFGRAVEPYMQGKKR